MNQFSESVVEQAALAWLESAGWQIKNGAEIAPGEPTAERDDFGQVILGQRLHDALARLNPRLPAEALQDAFRKLTRPEGAELVARNRALHRLLKFARSHHLEAMKWQPSDIWSVTSSARSLSTRATWGSSSSSR